MSDAGVTLARDAGWSRRSLVATLADTREVLQIRLRKESANSQKGIERFVDELIARVQRGGATAVKLLQADSGFWNTTVFKRLEQAGRQYSIAVRTTKTVRAGVEQIDQNAWTRIDDYPRDGEAQIAESNDGSRRLIVRRTRLIRAAGRAVARMAAPTRTEDIALVEAKHRDHAMRCLLALSSRVARRALGEAGQPSGRVADRCVAAVDL